MTLFLIWQRFVFGIPFDDDAYNYIMNSTEEVRREVLLNFIPKQEGEEDYSALIMGFTKKRRQFMRERQERGVYAQQTDFGLEDLEAFRARYPCDDEAFRFVTSAPPHVRQMILQTFKPPREGEEDYSALIITFSKKCRQATQQVPQREHMAYRDRRPTAGVNYEAFRARYPFDDDCHNFLQRLPPEVRIHVLQNFKPPREGEADYSALLMSFGKKTRENQQFRVQPLQQPATAPAPAYTYETRHIQQVPARAPERPQWNPPAPRRAESNTNTYALEGFRQRYPMDDRAFDFLKCASASTQQEVLERFAPQRQDSDYSALIISFAKKCREREQAQPSFAAKRPRMF